MKFSPHQYRNTIPLGFQYNAVKFLCMKSLPPVSLYTFPFNKKRPKWVKITNLFLPLQNPTKMLEKKKKYRQNYG